MPDNDFLGAMTAPANTAWDAPTPGGFYGGYMPPKWGSALTESRTDAMWGRSAGQYFGNIGEAFGNLMDANTDFLEGMGIYASPIREGRGSFSTRRQAEGVMDEMLEESRGDSRQRIQRRLGDLGMRAPDDTELEFLSGVGATSSLARNLLGGGDLTSIGIRSLYTTEQRQSNFWQPRRGQVEALRQGFQGYYGFGAGQTTNLNRTMGYSADELAEVTAITRSQMPDSEIGQYRQQATAEFNERQANIGAITGIDKKRMDAYDVAYQKTHGGQHAPLEEVMRYGVSGNEEKFSAAQAALGAYDMKKWGVANANVDTITEAKMMEKNTATLQTVQNFRDAGFTGSIGDLQKELGEYLGDAGPLGSSKMNAVSQKIKTITASTGTLLSSVVGMVKTIQQASEGMSGVRLSSEQAISIAGMALNPTQGVSDELNKAMSAKDAETMTRTVASKESLGLQTLQMFAPQELEKYNKLANGTPAERAQAESMMMATMSGGLINGQKGFNVGEEGRLAFQALSMGNVGDVQMMMQAKRDEMMPAVDAYNKAVAVAAAAPTDKTAAAEVARLKGGLDPSVTFDKDTGMATLATGVDMANQAAAKYQSNAIDQVAPSVNKDLDALGLRLAPNEKDPEKRRELAARAVSIYSSSKNPEDAKNKLAADISGNTNVQMKDLTAADSTAIAETTMKIHTATSEMPELKKNVDTMGMGLYDTDKAKDTAHRVAMQTIRTAGDEAMGRISTMFNDPKGIAHAAEGMFGATGLPPEYQTFVTQMSKPGVKGHEGDILKTMQGMADAATAMEQAKFDHNDTEATKQQNIINQGKDTLHQFGVDDNNDSVSKIIDDMVKDKDKVRQNLAQQGQDAAAGSSGSQITLGGTLTIDLTLPDGKRYTPTADTKDMTARQDTPGVQSN